MAEGAAGGRPRGDKMERRATLSSLPWNARASCKGPLNTVYITSAGGSAPREGYAAMRIARSREAVEIPLVRYIQFRRS